jgi:glycosyltransferase involved in cell wall biosynthesis
MRGLKYSIVVATRNRVEVLRLSLPRMLSQSPPPSQLIIVDSSDNHVEVVRAVQQAASAANTTLEPVVLQAERGLTRQRNLGLARVNQPIVFFPDDDSIFFPETAAAILAVYERDTTGLVAAVCAYDSAVPPIDFPADRAGYAMSRTDRLKRPLARLRARIEALFFPDPGFVLGQSLVAAASLPAWINDAGVNPVEWMTGYRMTFRTDVIQRLRFDEVLTRYCLFEDRDASFSAWRTGAVVATSKSRIYHHRSPEKRDAGRRMGVEQLLNQAYLIAKHTSRDHPARSSVQRFARYKILLYRLSARDDFARERLAGAKAAYMELSAILNAGPADSASRYTEAMCRCLPSR